MVQPSNQTCEKEPDDQATTALYLLDWMTEHAEQAGMAHRITPDPSNPMAPLEWREEILDK